MSTACSILPDATSSYQMTPGRSGVPAAVVLPQPSGSCSLLVRFQVTSASQPLVALDGFPYGGRLRLKAGYDASSFKGTQARVVIAALEKYGMINTDASGETRSSFRLGDGTKLDQADMAQLSKLTWDDFEVPAMTVVQSMACN